PSSGRRWFLAPSQQRPERMEMEGSGRHAAFDSRLEVRAGPFRAQDLQADFQRQRGLERRKIVGALFFSKADPFVDPRLQAWKLSQGHYNWHSSWPKWPAQNEPLPKLRKRSQRERASARAPVSNAATAAANTA